MAGTTCSFAQIPCAPCAPSLAPQERRASGEQLLILPRSRGCKRYAKCPPTLCKAHCENPSEGSGRSSEFETIWPRRQALAALSAVGLGLSLQERATAVQGMTAGRVPGVGPEDAEGYRKYTRPEGKSGGHGVGWTEFDPYSFKIPEGWEEVPVSIADLGGTEIDLRFSSPAQGNISVVVAPVLRFADLGENPSIDMIGSPDKVINAFGPEVIGQVVDDKVVYARSVTKEDGKLYYQFELNSPHVLIAATAASNRLYLFNVSATSRQWKKAEATLRKIADSFRVAKR